MADDFETEPTTFHVRRAREGDVRSRDWVTRRLTPVLLARARRSIPEEYRDRVNAEDAVAETWLAVYPRLSQLGERDGRSTPVFVRFLLEALHRTIRAQLRAARDRRRSAPGYDLTTIIGVSVPALQRLIEKEARGEALRAIEALEKSDRDLLLRYVSGDRIIDLAAEAGEKPNTLSKRLQRMIADLRSRLTGSVFDEFAD